MALMDIFSTRLRKLREVAGLTQAQLAEKLDVSRGSISYYENKDRVPDIEFLEKVTELFGVSFNFLMGYSNNKWEENETIGLKLGLTDKAIEKLSDDTDDVFHINGETLSLFLENNKFCAFMRTAERYLAIAANVENEPLDSYENEHIEFLLSKVLVLVMRDIVHQKYMNELHVLSEEQYNDKIARCLSKLNEIDAEYQTIIDKTRNRIDDFEGSLSDEERENRNIGLAVHRYLEDIKWYTSDTYLDLDDSE